MKFLVTGHTGFKGSWMTLMLHELGHEVHGVSLDPAPGGLYEVAGLSSIMASDHRHDIRDFEGLRSIFAQVKPEVVVHMAAQPLVLDSYEDPRHTFETNVMGTLNVLESLSACPELKACLVITTDKVYRNVGKLSGYKEDEPLGGEDPYSASKAMADMLTNSWRTSFGTAPIAVARAGNVIGGGDVSKDRLLPDLINSVIERRTITLRNPDAVRPWQHVLDCVYGYYALIQKMLSDGMEDDWNFGPDPSSAVSVSQIVEDAQRYLGLPIAWELVPGARKEAQLLTLDPSKAKALLDWANLAPYPDCLHLTLEWNKQCVQGVSPHSVTVSQIQDYLGKTQS